MAGIAPARPIASTPKVQNKHNTYVIVHGAWGGGWDWKHVDQLLTADGNTVYRPTLSGLGEHNNINSTNFDLDTHIQDVVNVIEWENLHDVVLVGHSYGGMVITGVADRIPDRIKCLIYLNALLPENGECAKDLSPDKSSKRLEDGFYVPFWVKPGTPPPHDIPMPEGTFDEPITLTNQAVAGKIPTTYILAVAHGKKPEQEGFYRFYERAQHRGWHMVLMEGDHNVQRTHPQELVNLFEQAP